MPWAPARIEEAIAFFIAAAERDALLELLRDVLGHELGVEVGALDLLDVELNVLLGQLLHLLGSLSTCSPLRPITRPGRAVRMPIVIRSPLRSIVIFEIPAW